jgi:TetR/AcrR family transcriptional regulator, regulator of cefoperazone and chloramphenicol sensitivity
VPRDSTATKTVLLREAERLFARRGLYQVTLREITEAAGQRNVSALNYHFGSREGVLAAILARHAQPMDTERGELRDAFGPAASTRELVAALVVPYAAHLARPEGRDYLRIVEQLAPTFSEWRRSPDATTGSRLREILTEIERGLVELPPVLRRERVVELIMLMTAALAERARAIESERALELDEPTFVANITDVLVGVLEAPFRGPIAIPPRSTAAVLAPAVAP